MKRLLLILITCQLSLTTALAQGKEGPFRAYLYNNEYEVFLNINLYDEDIEVPGQELYGPLPGYLGKKHNSFCWVITAAEVKGKTATLSLINDYGSEDLTATLTQQNDSTYILKQEKGSTLKVPKNSKWQKLPKTLELKRQKE
ncbi:MAG: hypothetical protein J5658_01790 [Prevotella sp.]|nr:hypothetical protein [Prevotella sp.]